MSKPSSYDLLKDINESINSLRNEMVPRFEKVEDRIGKLEQLGSKVAILWGIVTIGATATFTYVWEKVIKKT